MASETVVAAVKARIASEIPSSVVTFRDLDLAVNQERPPGNGPYLEIEFVGGGSAPDDFGSPDHNTWTEAGTILFHIFITHKTDMGVARTIWSAIYTAFVGRLFDDVFCDEVLAANEDLEPDGRFKGLTYSVSYEYEHDHA